MVSKELTSDHAAPTGDTALPPNGAAAAALMAAGIACATLGLAVALCEWSPVRVQAWLTLYAPAGPLSGKAVAATLAYFLSWGVLGLAWRGRNVRLGLWLTVAGALFIAGLLLTFPPIFEIFLSNR